MLWNEPELLRKYEIVELIFEYIFLYHIILVKYIQQAVFKYYRTKYPLQ
jgi:hypothetical protein